MQTAERKACKACGNPLIQVIENRLYRCSVCGLYYRVRDQTGVLPLTLGGQELEKTELGQAVVIQGSDVDKELEIFISRVAERLAPIEGLDAQASTRALRVQRQFHRELTDVLSGKQNFDKWFNETAVTLGLHTLTFIEILRQCLEGLQSQEVKKLRIEYDEYLNKLQRAYTPR